jgi:hypothetical protein
MYTDLSNKLYKSDMICMPVAEMQTNPRQVIRAAERRKKLLVQVNSYFQHQPRQKTRLISSFVKQNRDYRTS